MTRSIWMDLNEPVDRIPAAGDYVVTRGKRGWGSAYLIVAWREVRRVGRTTPERRFALTVQPGYLIEEALRFRPWVLHLVFESAAAQGLAAILGPLVAIVFAVEKVDVLVTARDLRLDHQFDRRFFVRLKRAVGLRPFRYLLDSFRDRVETGDQRPPARYIDKSLAHAASVTPAGRFLARARRTCAVVFAGGGRNRRKANELPRFARFPAKRRYTRLDASWSLLRPSGRVEMKNIGKKGRYSAPVVESTQTLQLKRKTPKRPDLDDSMYFQTEEIAAFFRVIESKRDRAIFRLVYHRGLRAHEVALIQYSDWRDRDGVLYVRRGKGSISREHSLIREEIAALRAYIKFERGTMPGPMFPSRQGRRGITPSRLDQIIKGYCKDAGIRREKAHMHALKHSCGTHLRERGNTADAIQDWLGHRDSKSTDIYMHFTRSRREESLEKNRDWS